MIMEVTGWGGNCLPTYPRDEFMLRKILLNKQLVIAKSDNPDLDVPKLKERFTFDNPAFFRAKALGFSTFAIPRTICLLEDAGHTLILPRGIVSQLLSDDPRLEIDDQTVVNQTELGSSRFTLKDFQVGPVDKMSAKFQGLLHAPPGAGKTIMAIDLILRQQQRSLILVHSKDLQQQWIERIKAFTDLTPGVIGADRFDIQAVTMAMVQSLNRPLDLHFVTQFGLVLLDECHHCPAPTFQTLVSQFPARYRYGLTATPVRLDNLSFLLHAVMGPIQATVGHEELFINGHILKPTIRVIHTNCYLPECRDYGHLLAMLTKDRERNNLIIENVIAETREGHSCLVLSERIDHAKALCLQFMKMFPDGKAAVITGADSKYKRGQAIEAMTTGKISVLFATKLADEGLDIQRLDRLFLTCPARSSNKISQQIGRILRTFEGKHNAIVFDFVDSLIGLAESQYCSRKQQAYRGYQIEEVPYGANDGSANYTQAVG
jgi:superfamily II DNA or RNA helicase